MYFLSILTVLSLSYLVAWLYVRSKEKYLSYSYIISTIHAIVVSIYSFSLLYENKQCIISDDVDWTVAEILLAYFIADGLCVAIWVSPRDIIMHHLIAVLGIGLAITLGIAHGLVLRFGITELSTPILNICWLMHKQRHKYLPFAGVLLILIYFVSRVLIIPEMINNCYGEMFQHLSPPLAIVGILTTGYLSCMNIFWFSRIVRTVVQY